MYSINKQDLYYLLSRNGTPLTLYRTFAEALADLNLINTQEAL